MTYEDVKRIRESATSVTCDNKELARLIDEAIEKQIPKKPKKTTNGYEYFCSFCAHNDVFTVIKNFKNNFWNPIKYCPECGQKLDWSEENGKHN